MAMGLTRHDIGQIAVLLTGCLLVVLNYTLLAPALPVIMHDMNVTETTVQWLTSVYSLVEAVVIPMNAFLLGRFSTRKLFAGALVLFALGSLAVAVGPTFELLIVGRVLQAMAGGVHLKELDVTTRPCRIEKTGPDGFTIILTQGLNRQIRRMCEAFGYGVKKLKRVRVVTVRLENMKPGEIVPLTEAEIRSLQEALRHKGEIHDI